MCSCFRRMLCSPAGFIAEGREGEKRWREDARSPQSMIGVTRPGFCSVFLRLEVVGALSGQCCPSGLEFELRVLVSQLSNGQDSGRARWT